MGDLARPRLRTALPFIDPPNRGTQPMINTWHDDPEYQEHTITEVEEDDDAWTMSLKGGGVIGLKKGQGPAVPREGATVRLFGKGFGFPVRGIVIDGEIGHYLPSTEQAQIRPRRRMLPEPDLVLWEVLMVSLYARRGLALKDNQFGRAKFLIALPAGENPVTIGSTWGRAYAVPEAEIESVIRKGTAYSGPIDGPRHEIKPQAVEIRTDRYPPRGDRVIWRVHLGSYTRFSESGPALFSLVVPRSANPVDVALSWAEHYGVKDPHVQKLDHAGECHSGPHE